MNSYYSLVNIKFKNKLFIFLFLVLFSILIVISILVNCYSSYMTYAKVSDNNLIISLPIENSDIITGNKIKINDNIYDYKILEISPLYEQNYVNFQDYKIKVNKFFRENEVMKVTFYYNKEKLIKKIVKIIF